LEHYKRAAADPAVADADIAKAVEHIRRSV
jgi:3-hydroxyisobutyrate dehydrogenase